MSQCSKKNTRKNHNTLHFWERQTDTERQYDTTVLRDREWDKRRESFVGRVPFSLLVGRYGRGERNLVGAGCEWGNIPQRSTVHLWNVTKWPLKRRYPKITTKWPRIRFKKHTILLQCTILEILNACSYWNNPVPSTSVESGKKHVNLARRCECLCMCTYC
jgi:hypothetical protein